MVAATAVVTGSLSVPAAVASERAGSQAAVKCTGSGTIFLPVKEADGATRLRVYSVSAPGTTEAAMGSFTLSGVGWDKFGNLFGGPGGRLYAVHPTDGLFRYRWSGTQWTEQRVNMSASFQTYAKEAHRNRITVDSRGDIYLIDTKGPLRHYRYDEAAKKWTIYGQVLATGWDKYDAVTAVAPGVLVARTPEGVTSWHRYDIDGQRWLVRDRTVGSGWGVFKRGLVSAGGGTLFGLEDNGRVMHYRYDPVKQGWPVAKVVVGSGFGVEHSDIAAVTDTCSDDLPNVPDVNVPQRVGSRIAAYRAPKASELDIAVTDNAGFIRHAKISGSAAQWSTISGEQAFADTPAIVPDAKGILSVYGHSRNGNVYEMTQTAEGSPQFKAPTSMGGELASATASVRLVDGRLAMFGVGENGRLRAREQEGSPDGMLLPWIELDSPKLAVTPQAVARADGSVELVGIDVTGTVHSARYQSQSIGAWSSLGGDGFTGRPAAVSMPGPRLRVFARTAGGSIVSQLQHQDGAFPQKWEPLGNLTTVGSPAAVIDGSDSTVTVVARTEDGGVFQATETAAGSGQWKAWARVNPAGERAATDVTLSNLAVNGVESWGVLFLTTDNDLRLWYKASGAGLRGGKPFEGRKFRIPAGRG
ncbi:hypothetical protein GCM10010201_24750 [Pilimelia columellifera subsp. columellifera]|uniref:Tachylectin 2 domain-containing protein n=1 Tax=Pilimelia columellifera subsp. columellifera TaxID=706583 RepID=A0ABP6AWD0_9ACTN